MGDIQLFNDGDGFAVIGDSASVDWFCTTEGLQASEFSLAPLKSALGQAGVALEGLADIAANSGRWVKLTPESAKLVKLFPLMKGPGVGTARAILTDHGSTKHILQIVTSTGSILTNPAVLANLGTMMSQYAMQQAMKEIKEYLVAIEAKVDDVLRAQNDAVLADMIGVGLVIDDAMTIRDSVGRVSEVTWSKVSGAAATIASTQAYALRQLDALAEKMGSKTDLDDIAQTTNQARPKVEQWLIVLARTFQLQDALAVIELDRVLDANPDELESHRIGLRTARQQRLERITRSTEQLLSRLDTAAHKANMAVLVHPWSARRVVEACEHTAIRIVQFEEVLDTSNDHKSLTARPWLEAAIEARDKVLNAGAEGVDSAGRVIGRAVDPFRSVDLDGDGIPDKPQALCAVEGVGTAIAEKAFGVRRRVGSIAKGASGSVQGAASGIAGAVGGRVNKPQSEDTSIDPALDAEDLPD